MTLVTGNRAQFAGDQDLDTHDGLAQEAHTGLDPRDGRREQGHQGGRQVRPQQLGGQWEASQV